MYLNIWKTFFSERKNLILFILNAILVVASLNLFARYLVFNESRDYVVKLNDPLFNYFSAIDLDILAFTLIYIPIISFFVYASFRPKGLLIAITSYWMLLIVRMFAMYVTPLDIPAGAIDLNDPIIFIIGTGQPVMRDLFFSGHTSTLTLLTLASFDIQKISGSTIKLKADRYYKYFILVSLIIVAFSVVLQKAHYTIDVFAAPFFAFGVYSFVKKLYRVA